MPPLIQRLRAWAPGREQLESHPWLRRFAPQLAHPKLGHWSRRGVAAGMAIGLFIGLSAYAVTTKKDCSFMGGFLMVGILLAFLAGLAAIFFQIPALSLTVSAAFVLLMSGLILYETSNIIHGGETNYVLATVTLFVSIFNLFTSLLQLLGFMNGDD